MQRLLLFGYEPYRYLARRAHRVRSLSAHDRMAGLRIGLRTQAPGRPDRDRGPGLHLRQHRPVRFRRLLDAGLHGHVHRRVPAGALAGDPGPPHHSEPAGPPCRAGRGSAMTAVTPGAAVETMKAIVQDEYGTAPEQVLRLAEIARSEEQTSE